MYVSRPLLLLILGVLRAYAEEVPYPTSSEDANKTYSSVGRRILQQLHSDDSGNQTTTFYVVLFAGGCHPRETFGGHGAVCDCVEHKTADPSTMDSHKAKVIIPMDGHTGVNVFTVADETNKSSSMELQDEWERMKGKRGKILKDTFDNDERYFPECISMRQGYGLSEDKGFRAVAVFRCALRFVWYELGWTYFEAYWTNSDYVLSYTNGATRWGKEECGTLVFFP